MNKQIDPNLNGSQDDILKSLGVDDIVDKAENGAELKDSEKSIADTTVDDILKQIEQGRSESERPSVIDSEEGEHSHHHHHHHHGEHSHHHHHHHRSTGNHSHHHHSGSHSHHHSKKRKKKKLPLAAKILIAIIVILLLIVVTVFGTFFALQHIGKKEAMPDLNSAVDYQDTIEYKGHTYKYNENLFTFAFMGVDQEDIKSSKNTDFVGAADATIVVSVDTKTGKSNVIAIPRDTMVDVDVWSESGVFVKTLETQLCLAYAYGDGSSQSCENTMTSMSRVLYNVPIEKYFMLDLSGVAPLNDAIGGVTVTPIYDIPNFDIKKGVEVTLKGDAAMAYVRTRDMDYLEASLNRVDRQVQYVKAYASQLAPAVLNDFSVVSNLYSTAQKYSQTNVSLSSATYIASMLLSKGVTSFDSYTLTGHMESDPDAVYEDVVHAKFYPDEDYLMETVLSVFYNQVD